jgi:hypothetical protein
MLDFIRSAWERTPFAFYTYFVIGAIGRKGAPAPEHSSG